jgi:adenosylcobalamin-dependent ribonucleoside-triphosphate reductase
MGTGFMYHRGGAALNNCGFISTRDLASDYADPFLWMMRMSMLGVGVGFDTRGKGSVTITEPKKSREPHRIGDSREGWTEAMAAILRAYTGKGPLPGGFDYSDIRPRGSRLKSFGGFASGPEPLRAMLESLGGLYRSYVGGKVDARLIVDTMNIVGRCVVAGGVRRSAQIAFGEPEDRQFLDLKTDREKVKEYRWVSNNSLFARRGMDYREAAGRSAVNGEPGYLWLENARAYGRMADPPDWADEDARGSNPCVEQTLWNRELCCLVETYPARHDTLDDYRRTLEIAYLYAKTVTLVATEDQSTNAVMLRNRRIGCSMTGVVQAINKLGYRAFLDWCDRSYRYVRELDARYSDRLCVPRSIKTTSVKPSGTVSLLAGATPGVHWEHAPYYLRRIRLTRDHPLVAMCGDAGYPVEEDVYSDNTMVVAFPVHIPLMGRGKAQVPLREKVDLAAQMQRFWSDNQVSVTAEFDPDTESGQLPRILEAYEDRLKAMVFLPSRTHGYEQPPYEAITEERYRALVVNLQPLRGDLAHEREFEARYCEGGLCEYGEDERRDGDEPGS